MYEDAPQEWTFEPPEKCDKTPTKLFAQRKPYNGIRVNTAILTFPFIPADIIYTRGLSSIRKPIPKCWSWRFRGTNKIEKGGIRDPGKCGGCWAFSMASALGDRYSLKYNIESPYPSSVWLITNARPPQIASNVECLTGGNTYYAGKWLERNSVKLEECWPYSVIRDNEYISPTNLNLLPDNCCVNCCDDFIKEKSETVFNCEPGSTKFIVNLKESADEIDVKSTIQSIQREIMINGPVVSSFTVYKDFMDYWIHDAKDSNKIYIRKSDESNGGHAVVLTGWGEINGVKYWEVRNSWGLTGDHGYCKISFSTITPVEKWIQIDIPLFNGQIYNGGVISFLPGELKNKKKFKKGIMFKEIKEQKDCDFDKKIKVNKTVKNKKINLLKYTEESSYKKNIFYPIIIIFGSLLIIFIVYKLISLLELSKKVDNISSIKRSLPKFNLNYRRSDSPY